MKITVARAGQAFSKLSFCLRVAADVKTFFRLLVQSKLLNHPKDGDPGAYDRHAGALVYRIRFLLQTRDIYLRTYTGDIRIFYEVFWERAYWLPPSFEAPLVVVDAGAHVGMTASYFSMVYPKAILCCIEPDADNFKLLSKNLESLVKEGRGRLLQAALYDRDGRVELVKERWSYNSRVIDGGADRAVERDTVRAVSPGTIFREFQLEKIDLLKIDIEGAEDKLFSTEGPIDWLQKVHMLLIEVHRAESVGSIRERLTENGFHWQRWGRASTERAKGSEAEGSLYLASRTEIPRLAH